MAETPQIRCLYEERVYPCHHRAELKCPKCSSNRVENYLLTFVRCLDCADRNITVYWRPLCWAHWVQAQMDRPRSWDE